MQLNTTYRGSEFPFEGDRTLWLRCLPQYAQVQTARLTVAPALRPGATEPSFAETLDFRSGQPFSSRYGASIRSGTGFVEIDFGTRRTLVSLVGANLTNAMLQVELGGIYVPISSAGTVLANGGTPLQLVVNNNVAELPGLTVNKFKLMPPVGVGGATTISQINIHSAPSTITARIGTQPNFWVRPAELSYAADSPDFAELLNIALTETEIKDGFYQLPIVIHSDTLCRLDVTLTLDYLIEQPILPPHLPEVRIPYNYSSLPGIQDDLLEVELPRGAVPITGSTNALVVGQFKDTRVAWAWDELGELPDTTFSVKVSPQMALAQPIITDREIQVLGIDLPMDRATPGLSGLSIAIQADHDGKPSGTILVTAALVVQKPLPEQTIWASAALDNPFRIEANQRYWLVLQSQVSEAYWLTTYLADVLEPLQVTINNAFSWRVLNHPDAQGSVHALFRLRNKPEQFTIPLALRLGKRPATLRRLDEFAPLGKIEFNFDFAEKLQEHLDLLTSDSETDGTDECGTEELLVNESFVYPAPEDATYRLFGVYGDSSATPTPLDGSVDLRQGVDLSHERFITVQLSFDLVHRDGDQSGTPVNFSLQQRINCAGITPARTSLDTIVQRINTALQQAALRAIAGNQAAQPFETVLGTIEVAVDQLAADNETPTGRLRLRTGQVATETLPTPTDPDTPPIEIGSVPAADAQVLQSRVVNVTNIRLVPWCDKLMPSGWRGSGRHIARLNVGDVSGRLGVVLIHPEARILLQREQGIGALECVDPLEPSPIPDVEAWLSQRVGVRDQCTYLFRLIYTFAATRNVSPRDGIGGIIRDPQQPVGMAPFWEIVWADVANRPLRTDSGFIEAASLRRSGELTIFEQPLHPPTGAVSAELRIVYPFDQVGLLFIERASFMPTNLRVRNSYFQYFDQTTRTFTGWETVRGLVAPDPLATTSTLPLLDGAGPDDAILAQQLSINGGAAYEFRVSAQPRSIAAANPQSLPMTRRARAELCWLLDDLCIGTVTIPLDEMGFAEHVWAGKAPPDATDATITLIQPRAGGSLVVEYAELLAVDNLRVPLYFLAESPGELAVSKLKVTYDSPLRARPMLTPVQDEVVPNQSGSEVAPILFNPGISVNGDVDDDNCDDEDMADTAAQIPLTSVSRVGPVRARVLVAAGIDNVRKLASSDAASVRRLLKQTGGFTDAMAHEIITDARRLVHEADNTTDEPQ